MDRDRQAFTETLPSVIFRREIAVNRYARAHQQAHHLKSHYPSTRILVLQIEVWSLIILLVKTLGVVSIQP